MKFSEVALSATALVPVRGGELSVRGLSLVDIMAIYERHREALDAAFAGLAGEDNKAVETMLADPLKIAGAFCAAMPQVIADLISIAGDEPDAVAVIRKFPVSLQITLVEKIVELTFEAEGGAKKVIETIISAVGGMSNLLSSLIKDQAR